MTDQPRPNQKKECNYIVLAELLNLNSIATRSKELVVKEDRPEAPAKEILMPGFYFQIGDEITIDIAKLNEVQKGQLAYLEISNAIVRLNTNYNAELLKKKITDVDLYKVQIKNTFVYYNTIVDTLTINNFCQKWEDKKAFILNPQFVGYSTQLIEEFYLSI